MRVRSALLLLLLVGPTLVVPIDIWHHHEDGQHEHGYCALCVAAAAIIPDSQPATVLPVFDLICLQALRPEAPTGVSQPAPVRARAPPPAQFPV